MPILRSIARKAALVICLNGSVGAAEENQAVTVDNFPRAESDLYFAGFVADGSFGSFVHAREMTPIKEQDVIRMNRDTLYSSAVADLDAGPVTVTLPESKGRFVSIQVINQDHYVPAVIYEPGAHTFTGEDIGTRYVLFLARTFVDPTDPADLETVHAVQDAMSVQQGEGASFEIPDWNTTQADAIRTALNELAAANGGIDSARMFGTQDVVDRVQHLIGTAAGWGGNPPDDAYYVGGTPVRNDGETIHRLTVGDVPVDGFWSISVYNADGYFEANEFDRYSINNVTADRSSDGSVEVQFGGCTADLANCLPVTTGWNYLVRLYRPAPEILDGSWTFPALTPVE